MLYPNLFLSDIAPCLIKYILTCFHVELLVRHHCLIIQYQDRRRIYVMTFGNLYP